LRWVYSPKEEKMALVLTEKKRKKKKKGLLGRLWAKVKEIIGDAEAKSTSTNASATAAFPQGAAADKSLSARRDGANGNILVMYKDVDDKIHYAYIDVVENRDKFPYEVIDAEVGGYRTCKDKNGKYWLISADDKIKYVSASQYPMGLYFKENKLLLKMNVSGQVIETDMSVNAVVGGTSVTLQPHYTSIADLVAALPPPTAPGTP